MVLNEYSNSSRNTAQRNQLINPDEEHQVWQESELKYQHQ